MNEYFSLIAMSLWAMKRGKISHTYINQRLNFETDFLEPDKDPYTQIKLLTTPFN